MTRLYFASALVLAGVLFLPGSALAQKYEIFPYAGGFMNGDWADIGQLKNEGIYGIKAGALITERTQIEGNFGYINHFEFEDNDPPSRGFLWDANVAYNIFPSAFSNIAPYVTVGLGGVTTVVEEDFINEDAIFGEGPAFDDAEDRAVMAIRSPSGNLLRTVTVEDGDTFFAVSYGGGIKAQRLWGPLGLRADFRGRSLPNFFGNSATWFETTGGVTFSWGER